MGRKPDIGNVKLYPDRPLRSSDRGGYVLQFYCPIQGKRIRRACGTRDRSEARRIQRECRTRLSNGSYAESGGAITDAEATILAAKAPRLTVEAVSMPWDAAFEQYLDSYRLRYRDSAYKAVVSRLNSAKRILEQRRKESGWDGELTVAECVTVEAVEYLENRLLEGAEGRKIKDAKGQLMPKPRSPHTVNSMVGTILPFYEYCRDRKWCGELHRPEDLPADDPMKGRPITGEEFERMLAATPLVVGKGSAESWLFALRVLWESAFRVQDLMEFSWDDTAYVHPVWPTKPGQHPTISIPSAQKNRKCQEIPMLPGLAQLLNEVPQEKRTGWVVDPQPREMVTKSQTNWFQPSPEHLAGLLPVYSNVAIAKACGVSDRTVGVWIRKQGLSRTAPIRKPGVSIPETLVRQLRANAIHDNAKVIVRSERLSLDRVGKVISMIGKQAGVVVKAPRKGEAGKIKYASAHDIRRGVGVRLVNAGVSAETLRVLMRHKNQDTTEKYYTGIKHAQTAATEINGKMAGVDENSEFVGRLVGRILDPTNLTPDQLKTLKSLLEAI
jgi:integrase